MADVTDTREALLAELMAFVAAPDPAAFDALADRVVAYQIGALPAYGRLVAARGGPPPSWRSAPLVPTDLFKDVDLCSHPGEAAVFRTSGTTVGARGARRVPDLGLYDAAMAGPFVAHVLAGDDARRPWLSLVPPVEEAPDSSLSHMVSALAARYASDVLWALHPERGVDVRACETFARKAKPKRPVVVLTTAFALAHLLEAIAAPVPLPPRSRLMVTGGFKGKAREVSEEAQLAEIEWLLGLTPDEVVPEYGMTELTSQAYGRPLVANPGLRLRVVDPRTQADLPPGEVGLVACFDLLNLDNVSALLTGDLGQLDQAGRLTLLGRAPDAVVRGCSLTAEELHARTAR
ncbi:MAG: hypothetical protein CVU56_12640 [Deltaproteobacteria bacterium HGW-Deltaproteobacteria-14]|jgi:hypothetical protein|nr:MAG: hypothetical protein CVU56_12640 [Deltaproteobacteria bacterium HGW-Deltaproteobacteria-14]